MPYLASMSIVCNGQHFQFPDVLRDIILEYTAEYVILPWVDESKFISYWLSRNPGAIHLLEKNPEKIYWALLSRNPAAIHLLEKNLEKINWGTLSSNPNIFKLTLNRGIRELL